MKKYLALIMSIVLLLGLCLVSYAALPDDNSPQWLNISTIVSTLGFSGTHGGATGSVDGKSGTSKVQATLTVYKQVGGIWEYVDSDSDSTTTDDYIALSVGFNGLSNTNYKSVFEVSVTRNGITESTTKTCYETCP